jgi:hypothetical protein
MPYSSDNGTTWQIDSAFNGTVSEMSVVSPHVIRMSLRDTAPSVIFGTTRSLAYSFNNGATWSVDSITFKSDSIILQIDDIYWLDARHGWVVAQNDIPPPYTDTPVDFIYYYDADANAGVQTSIVGIKYGTIRVYPDPATNIIYTDVTDDTLQIYDPLGRKYRVTMTGDVIDVSRHSSGVYFLYDGIAVRAKFLKE